VKKTGGGGGGGAYRRTVERPYLEFAINQWLEDSHQNDHLAFARPPHTILSDAKRSLLVKTQKSKVKTVADLIALLNETEEWAEEWGESLLAVLAKFEADFKAHPPARGNSDEPLTLAPLTAVRPSLPAATRAKKWTSDQSDTQPLAGSSRGSTNTKRGRKSK
jgi:hypothetical protein